MTLLRHVRGTAVTVAACLFIAVPAMANQVVVLSPTFTEDSIDTPTAKGAPACTVNFTASDDRRDHDMAGVVGRVAVHSPTDSQAWMRAILGGLARRGVTPQFDSAAPDATAPSAGAPAATFSLQMAWISPSGDTLSANVVVAVDATGADGHTLHQTYRGRKTKMNWASGASEMQSVMDQAFSDVLTKMTPDLQTLCPAAPAS